MNNSENNLLKYKNSSLSHRVYDLLQEKILNGAYEDGERLCESKLTDEFGVSRTPVREAIFQLEQEGLVSIIPNKGAVVNAVSADDIKDIYSIRLKIEGLAARWAAERITPYEIEQLQEIMDLMTMYTMKADIDRILKIDSQFHSLIFDASKSRPLMQTLEPLHRYVMKARKISFQKPGRAAKALEEHRNIYKAILDKLPDLAEQLTILHITNAERNLIDY